MEYINLFKIENMSAFNIVIWLFESAMIICFLMSFFGRNRFVRFIISNVFSLYYGGFIGFVLGVFLFKGYIGILISISICIGFMIVLNNCIKTEYRLVPEFCFWWQVIYIIAMVFFRMTNLEKILLKILFDSRKEYRIFDCDGSVGGYEYHLIVIFAAIVAFALSILVCVKNNFYKKNSSYNFVYYSFLSIIIIMSIWIGRDPLVGIIANPNYLLDGFFPTMGLGYLPFNYYMDYLITAMTIALTGTGIWCFVKKM